MPYVPNKMQGKVPYEPVMGDFRVRLDANESPFDLPETIKTAFAEDLLTLPVNRYPDPTSRAVREAFAARYGINAAHVVAGNGSDELIGVIVSALMQKGDRLAVATPEFSMYAQYAEVSENTVCYHKKGKDYTLDDLLSFVKDNECQAVVLSNPCNPTGEGFDRETVLRFVADCPALCLVDEAYMDFWDQSILDVAHTYPNLIVLRTLSKALGSAGIRLGFAVASPALIAALNAARSPYNLNSLTQALGERILREAPDRAAYLAGQAQKLSAALTALLPADAYVHPTHANFVYVECPQARRIFDGLAARGIAVRVFGQDRLRITASTDEEQSLLLTALEDILSK